MCASLALPDAPSVPERVRAVSARPHKWLAHVADSASPAASAPARRWCECLSRHFPLIAMLVALAFFVAHDPRVESALLLLAQGSM